MIEKDWVDILASSINAMHPKLPKPRIWEKYGQVRLYFNRKDQYGKDMTFFIDFPQDEPKLKNFRTTYWSEILGITSYEDFISSIQKIWNSIIHDSLLKQSKKVDIDKVKIQEDLLLEKKCMQCFNVFKSYKSERATFCGNCKKRI